MPERTSRRPRTVVGARQGAAGEVESACGDQRAAIGDAGRTSARQSQVGHQGQRRLRLDSNVLRQAAGLWDSAAEDLSRAALWAAGGALTGGETQGVHR